MSPSILYGKLFQGSEKYVEGFGASRHQLRNFTKHAQALALAIFMKPFNLVLQTRPLAPTELAHSMNSAGDLLRNAYSSREEPSLNSNPGGVVGQLSTVELNNQSEKRLRASPA